MEPKERYKDRDRYIIEYNEYDEYDGHTGYWCPKTEVVKLPRAVDIYYESLKKNSQWNNVKVERILKVEKIDITQTLCYIEYKKQQEELAQLERIRKEAKELELKTKTEEKEREIYERLKKKFEVSE
jgi:hypothetical protein